MDIRIGVIQTAKEVVLDMGDTVDRAAVQSQINDVLGDEDKVLWLTDKKGRTVAIPSKRIAYVDLGAEEDKRKVGFGG
jgi:Protein of unknown function (DUF3107)